MRLISFGCSFTFGHGLSDCFRPPKSPGLHPSNYAWPSLVAKELDVECINKASCGSSNKRIWHNIIKFDFKKDDVVFIMWSNPDRHCILNSNEDIDIGPWTADSEIYYKKFHSSYDSVLMSKLFVNNANSFLKDKGIEVYNLIIGKEYKSIFKLDKETDHLPVYMASYRLQFPFALDNQHPGEECHKEVARLILEQIKVEHTIPKQQKLSLITRCKLFLKHWEP